MNPKQIMEIFQDTAYVRMGGSPEELRCAEYLKDSAPGWVWKPRSFPLM